MLTIRADTRGTTSALETLVRSLVDGRKILSAFYVAYRAQIARAWNIKTPGGKFRGTFDWKRPVKQYTRKDGTVVEAEGGVPRVAPGYIKADKWEGGRLRRGVSTGVRMEEVEGVVSGRLRRSGTRWTPDSIIGRDTGQMFDKFFPPFPDDVTGDRLIVGGRAPDYATYFHARRPFIAWKDPDDSRLFEVTAQEVLDRELQKLFG